jgi:hypothetical protein
MLFVQSTQNLALLNFLYGRSLCLRTPNACHHHQTGQPAEERVPGAEERRADAAAGGEHK